ncbi:hypothetical protein Tco_0562605 [Tanacetum coccineum]
MHAAEEADRRDDQVRQIVAIHQRIKAERQAKGTKEGGNGRKRQAPSHLDDSNTGEGNQTKGHPEFLSGDNNLFFVFRRGRRNGRTKCNIEAVIRRHTYSTYVDERSVHRFYTNIALKLRQIKSLMIPSTTSLIGFSRETIWPIGQISLLVKIGDEEHSTYAWMNFMVIRSPTATDQRNNRQNGYKKNPCRTIHGTWNVKIPGKRMNGNHTKQQSHPDKMCNDLWT